MAINKEQIFAAADELDAEGQNPTLANVRKKLGGTGSFTTISDAMQEWRAKKAAQAAPIREPAPQAITDKLAELGGDLWAVALEIANGRLATEREALEAVRQEMEGAHQEAVELADQLSTDLDEANGRIKVLESAQQKSAVLAAELQEKLNRASERAATAEARAGELRQELDHSHAEVKNARGERDGAMDRFNRVAELNEDLKGQRDQARQAEAEARNAQRIAENTEAALLTRIDALETAHKERISALKSVHQDRIEAAELAAARQAQQLTFAQEAGAAAATEASHAREALAAAQGQLEAVQRQNETLRADLMRLASAASANDKGKGATKSD